MQSVLFTPVMVNSYVNESLALLRFRQIVDRFGMFFLHELDLTKANCLPEILEVDDMGVIKALGGKLPKPKRRMEGVLGDDGYPLGATPSWQEVRQTIGQKPWELMRKWRWPTDLEDAVTEQLDSPAKIAGDLFAQFTTHFWSLLNGKWQCPNLLTVTAVTAQEALEYWTVESVYERLKQCTFLASNAGLTGAIPGTRQVSFEERVTLYFPQESAEIGLHWKKLTAEPAYIARYWETTRKMTDNQIADLNTWLKHLLSHCQCLPDSTRASPWTMKGDSVLITTNPLYYRLRGIGKSGRRGGVRRKGSVHTGVSAFKQRLLELQGIDPKTAATCVRLQGRKIKRPRSSKAKNKRKPPQRKRKDPQPTEEEEMEDNDSEKYMDMDAGHPNQEDILGECMGIDVEDDEEDWDDEEGEENESGDEMMDGDDEDSWDMEVD